jgi:hypothetical protein
VRHFASRIVASSLTALEAPCRCLLEIWTAITHNVPIVAVNIRGGHPYDYEDAASFLMELDTLLNERNSGAMDLLVDRGVEPFDIAFKLSSVLPNIISSELSVMCAHTPTPHGHGHGREAWPRAGLGVNGLLIGRERA